MEGSYYGPVHASIMNHGGLRLCTVRKTVKKRSHRLNTDQETEERKALFHGWSAIAQLVDASPLIGGHPGGTVADTFAIVEYMDGNIERVRPEQIKFLDTEEFMPTGKRRKSK